MVFPMPGKRCITTGTKVNCKFHRRLLGDEPMMTRARTHVYARSRIATGLSRPVGQLFAVYRKQFCRTALSRQNERTVQETCDSTERVVFQKTTRWYTHPDNIRVAPRINWTSSYFPRDRDRDRDRGFGCIASCVPTLLCCMPLSKLLLHVLMSVWSDVKSRRQRRYERKSQGWRAQSGLHVPEWQCAACKTQSFFSREACRGSGKQRDVKQDEYINEWVTDCGLATTEWKFPGEAAHPGNKPKGLAQAPGNSWHKPEHRRCPKRAFASWRTRCSSRRRR